MLYVKRSKETKGKYKERQRALKKNLANLFMQSCNPGQVHNDFNKPKFNDVAKKFWILVLKFFFISSGEASLKVYRGIFKNTGCINKRQHLIFMNVRCYKSLSGADLGGWIGWLATHYMTGQPKSCRLHHYSDTVVLICMNRCITAV